MGTQTMAYLDPLPLPGNKSLRSSCYLRNPCTGGSSAISIKSSNDILSRVPAWDKSNFPWSWWVNTKSQATYTIGEEPWPRLAPKDALRCWNNEEKRNNSGKPNRYQRLSDFEVLYYALKSPATIQFFMLSGNECPRIATGTENYVFHKFLSTSKTAKRAAYVAGVRKGRGRELGRETTREEEGGEERVYFPPSSRAPSRSCRASNSLSHPFQTPATQATKEWQSNTFREVFGSLNNPTSTKLVFKKKPANARGLPRGK